MGRFPKHQSSTADEHAREGQDRRSEPEDAPNHFREPSKPAKMQLREPEQALVDKSIRGVKQEQGICYSGKREVNPRQTPNQHERQYPKPQRAVQVPTDSSKVCSPVHCHAATPVLNSRPPYYRPSQT